MPLVWVPAGGQDAASVVALPAEEVGKVMAFRRISDLTKKVRIRAYGGLGKAVPMKAIKGQTMKARKAK